ncbi:MAG: site-2 protease family protein [Gemmatimonadota bacterium]|nr:MAG: site-2 protease family protein [Gemmatimonadota bacterium]
MTLLSIPVLLFAVVIHEVSHGWMADRLGDPTARYAGRLTLNPLPHIDLFGSVLLPAMLLLSGSHFLFGYAKPVPVNPYNLRDPKRDMMWVGLSGPAVNIILAFCCGILFRLLYRPGVVGVFGIPVSFLAIGVIINLVLACFNLIPIPPLDGSRILLRFLPPEYEYSFLRLERYGIFIVFGLIIVGPMIGLNIIGWILFAFVTPFCFLFTGYSFTQLYFIARMLV